MRHCKHCGVEIIWNGVLWVQRQIIPFPQYCFPLKSQTHEPLESEDVK